MCWFLWLKKMLSPQSKTEQSGYYNQCRLKAGIDVQGSVAEILRDKTMNQKKMNCPLDDKQNNHFSY